MARAKGKSQPATTPRRLTRQGLRDAYAQFSNLPLEVVRLIAVAAAQDNVASNPKWVAQSLALVCREFCRAVEPVLVDTLRITESNSALILKGQHRFLRTRRLLLYFRLRTTPLCVYYMARNFGFHPTVVTVRMEDRTVPSISQHLAAGETGATHLHIRLCHVQSLNSLSLFMSASATHPVTHLITYSTRSFKAIPQPASSTALPISFECALPCTDSSSAAWVSRTTSDTVS